MRNRIMIWLCLACLVALFAASAQAQMPAYQINYGAVTPAICNPLTGDVFIVNAGAGAGLYRCTAVNTWTPYLVQGTPTLVINGVTDTPVVFNVTGFQSLAAFRRLDAGILDVYFQNLQTGFTATDGTTLSVENTSGDFRIVQLEAGEDIQFWLDGAFQWLMNGATIRSAGTTFALLAAPADGTMVFCSDCTKATPCAAAGPGALAVRLAGAWDCNP